MFGFGKKPEDTEEQAPELAPLPDPTPPDEPELVVENPAPDTLPAPAPIEPEESRSADHGFPSPRRVAPQE